MASLTATPASVMNGSVTAGPAWTNPGNAATDNDSYASVFIDMAETSEVLEATNFDFSAVPVGATIDGLAATVRGFVETGASGAALLNDAAFYRATGTAWHLATTDFTGGLPETEEARAAGGATDLAGTTWTRADVTDSGFGVRFTVVSGGLDPATVRVDSVTVTVYFTPAGGTAVANKVVAVGQAVRRAATH